MSQKKCPSCQNHVPAHSKFCPECGSPLSKKAVEKAKSPKNNTTRDTLIIIVVLVVVASAYFIINKPAAPPVSQEEEHVHIQDRPQMTEKELNTAISTLPTDYNSLVQFGNQAMDQGYYALAVEAYKRALIINPDSPNVRTDYGACLHAMGLEELALAEFMTVTTKYPTHTIANFNLGIVYFTMSQIDSSKHYFNKFLSLEPTGKTADQAKKYLAELNK